MQPIDIQKMASQRSNFNNIEAPSKTLHTKHMKSVGTGVGTDGALILGGKSVNIQTPMS